MPVPFRRARLAAAVSAALASTGAQAFDFSALDPEFEVPLDSQNTPQLKPDIASDADGNFVVVWQEGYSFNGDIFAQRFNADGSRAGTEIQVSPVPGGPDPSPVSDQSPVVAMDADGDFVVAWERYDYYGGASYEIAYRLFNADGTEAAPMQFASDTFTERAFEPDVAMDADGDIVIAWEQYQSSASNYEVAYRLFNAGTGTPVADPAFANVNSPGFHPEIGRAPTGEFVIAWESIDGSAATSHDVFGRRFMADGSALDTSEFTVNTTTGNDEKSAGVGIDPDGDFAIGWRVEDPVTGAPLGMRYRVLDWNGVELIGETEFASAAQTDNPPFDEPPGVAIRCDNHVLLSWSGPDPAAATGPEHAVYLRSFGPNGSLDTGVVQASEDPSGDDHLSGVAMDPSGDFVVAWERRPYLDPDDVFARRYDAPSTPSGCGTPPTGTGGGSGVTVSGSTTGTGSVGWLGALGLGLLALGRRVFRARRRGGTAGLLAGALALGALGGAPTAEAQSQEAGSVEQAQGPVTALRPGESARSLAAGDSIFTGDRVRTGAGGRAVLRLLDGTQVSLRPDSDFRVAALERTQTEGGEATLSGFFMDLLRGGLRMITGRVGRDHPQRFQLRTPVATIGVRGTEFDARLCRFDECPPIEAEVEEGPPPIARVLRIEGVVQAAGLNDAARVLAPGAGIYRDDTVTTGGDAWVVLRFTDQSKVSLQPDTEFRVDEWEFDRSEPEQGNALLNLLRGGMRVLTGLIGQEATEEYRVATPVATIGVRGTGFDLQCIGRCIDTAVESLQALQGDGLLLSTWDGTAFARLEGRLAEFSAGQNGFLANATAEPLRLAQLPQLLRELPAPRPDSVSGVAPEGTDRLYSSVDQGGIRVQGVQGGPLVVAVGSAVVVPAGGAAQPLAAIPAAVGSGLGVAGAAGTGATLAGAFAQLLLGQFELGSWYVGGTAGAATAGDEGEFEDRLQRSFSDVSVEDLDGESFGGRVFGGFRLLGLIGLEVGYIELGELDSEINPGSASPSAVAQDALDKHPFTPSGLDVSALVGAPLGVAGTTRAFARAGVFIWEGEVKTRTPSGETFKETFDGTDPLVGGGVEYQIGPRLYARAEWIHYRIDPDPVNYVGAGVVWTLP